MSDQAPAPPPPLPGQAAPAQSPPASTTQPDLASLISEVKGFRDLIAGVLAEPENPPAATSAPDPVEELYAELVGRIPEAARKHLPSADKPLKSRIEAALVAAKIATALGGSSQPMPTRGGGVPASPSTAQPDIQRPISVAELAKRPKAELDALLVQFQKKAG